MELREFHAGIGGRLTEVNGCEVVETYGDLTAEYRALTDSAGFLDLSFRSRLCVLGADRVKFLHGQVTNDVNRLAVGEGCYAALVDAKGKMQSDLNIFRLEDELLLDFEPGYAASVKQRLERYVIADVVEVMDVSTQYGLLSVQGPRAAGAIDGAGLGLTLPGRTLGFASRRDETLGEVYLANNPRVGSPGFDLFVPVAALADAANRLLAAVHALGGCAAGWTALETARVEACIPRYGADMDETNLAPEVGLDDRAISYTKGCYIGQEVIARIRTYGQVAKRLRRIELPGEVAELPGRGARLRREGKEVGYVTSAVRSPVTGICTGLAYVRREVTEEETILRLEMDGAEVPVRVTGLGQMDA